MTTLSNDELAQAMRLPASLLADAVDRHDPSAVADLLEPLNRQELYALAVVLAAHCEVPLVDTRRRPTDVDEIRVRRIIEGDFSLCAEVTMAERRDVVDRLRARGWTMSAIAKAGGWSKSAVEKDVERTGRERLAAITREAG